MEEFKEIIFFTLACIGAVIVITSYSAFRELTSQMVETRHEEIYEQNAVEFERIYGVLHESEISGVEVIALLRENALNKAECTVKIDRNVNNNSMEQNFSNYKNFTLSVLTSLLNADSYYHVTVDGEIVSLVRR